MKHSFFGETAQAAYVKITGDKTCFGLPVPTWTDLTDKERAAWHAAGEAAASATIAYSEKDANLE